jgi:hypothetical protein
MVGKPRGKRIFGRPRRKLDNNIRIELRERGYKTAEWIHLAKDKSQRWIILNTIMKHRVPYKAGNFLTSCVTSSFSRRTLFQEVSKKGFGTVACIRIYTQTDGTVRLITKRPSQRWFCPFVQESRFVWHSKLSPPRAFRNFPLWFKFQVQFPKRW